MKTLLAFYALAMLISIPIANAQNQYTVDGKQYTLKTDVEGSLTLLWNTIDGEYRYFLQKGDKVTELINTLVERKYQEEYKEYLQLQTADVTISVEKVKLTLPSLRDFFNDYNSQKDPNYITQNKDIQIKIRLGVFAGISNNIYTENPDNTLLPVAGVDFEIIEEAHLKRHSLVIQFKQTFENSDYKYSASQFSLNYRFKFVKTETFDVFVNTKIASYTYVKRDIEVIVPGPADIPIVTVVTESGGSFQAPVIFGVGADITVGKGYITFSYNDIVGIVIENNGEFPVDFTLGYKFNL